MANELARALRKAMTPQERKRWFFLRRMKVDGFHFRRQAPFEAYILDFVCFTKRIVVEIDGSQHNEPNHKARDAEPDAFLRARGFAVVRVWNNDVDTDLDGVMRAIKAARRS